MKLIDVHVHLFEPGKPYTIEDILGWYDRVGIPKLVGSASSEPAGFPTLDAANAATARARDRHPDRICPSLFVDLKDPDETARQADRWLGREKFVMMGEIMAFYGAGVDNPATAAMMEKAREYNIAVQFHTHNRDHSERLGRLAACYPDVRILMCHVGGARGWMEGLGIIKQHPNIIAEVSGSGLFLFNKIETCAAVLGAHRVCVGTDIPHCDLDAFAARIRYLRLTEEEKEWVCWRTVASFLNAQV